MKCFDMICQIRHVSVLNTRLKKKGLNTAESLWLPYQQINQDRRHIIDC